MKFLGSMGKTSFRIETESVDVSSWGPVPDEKWTYVDDEGHGHFYDNGYPTLEKIMITVYDAEEDEEHEILDHYECPHCQERINPGTVPSYTKQLIPGMRRYWVEDEEVTREQFQEIYRLHLIDGIQDQLDAL